MTRARTLGALALVSLKPMSLVIGALGLLAILVIAVIGFIGIYARNPERRKDAQAVLRTLLGRGSQ
jgi:hypothetical protein